jgi:hypothetical protein
MGGCLTKISGVKFDNKFFDKYLVVLDYADHIT